MSKQSSRRNFIQKITTGVVGATLVPDVLRASANGPAKIEQLKRLNQFSANDNIQIALIGAGGMGTADANTAITIPGVKLVAACDLYEGRLADSKKRYGNDIFTTRDYREILQRKDWKCWGRVFTYLRHHSLRF